MTEDKNPLGQGEAEKYPGIRDAIVTYNKEIDILDGVTLKPKAFQRARAILFGTESAHHRYFHCKTMEFDSTHRTYVFTFDMDETLYVPGEQTLNEFHLPGISKQVSETQFQPQHNKET